MQMNTYEPTHWLGQDRLNHVGETVTGREKSWSERGSDKDKVTAYERQANTQQRGKKNRIESWERMSGRSL